MKSNTKARRHHLRFRIFTSALYLTVFPALPLPSSTVLSKVPNDGDDDHDNDEKDDEDDNKFGNDGNAVDADADAVDDDDNDDDDDMNVFKIWKKRQ